MKQPWWHGDASRSHMAVMAGGYFAELCTAPLLHCSQRCGFRVGRAAVAPREPVWRRDARGNLAIWSDPGELRDLAVLDISQGIPWCTERPKTKPGIWMGIRGKRWLVENKNKHWLANFFFCQKDAKFTKRCAFLSAGAPSIRTRSMFPVLDVNVPGNLSHHPQQVWSTATGGWHAWQLGGGTFVGPPISCGICGIRSIPLLEPAFLCCELPIFGSSNEHRLIRYGRRWFCIFFNTHNADVSLPSWITRLLYWLSSNGIPYFSRTISIGQMSRWYFLARRKAGEPVLSWWLHWFTWRGSSGILSALRNFGAGIGDDYDRWALFTIKQFCLAVNKWEFNQENMGFI